jgi:hypothetical protein
VTKQLDALVLANKVACNSQSGILSRDLLVQGQTLYGKNADFPDYIERIMPDGRKSLGHWRNDEFQQIINLL